jgi:hypothetical protein
MKVRRMLPELPLLPNILACLISKADTERQKKVNLCFADATFPVELA